jgi:hypothetical protein
VSLLRPALFRRLRHANDILHKSMFNVLIDLADGAEMMRGAFLPDLGYLVSDVASTADVSVRPSSIFAIPKTPKTSNIETRGRHDPIVLLLFGAAHHGSAYMQSTFSFTGFSIALGCSPHDVQLTRTGRQTDPQNSIRDACAAILSLHGRAVSNNLVFFFPQRILDTPASTAMTGFART